MMDERDDERIEDWTTEGMTLTFAEGDDDDADARRAFDEALRRQGYEVPDASVTQPEDVPMGDPPRASEPIDDHWWFEPAPDPAESPQPVQSAVEEAPKPAPTPAAPVPVAQAPALPPPPADEHAARAPSTLADSRPPTPPAFLGTLLKRPGPATPEEVGRPSASDSLAPAAPPIADSHPVVDAPPSVAPAPESVVEDPSAAMPQVPEDPWAAQIIVDRQGPGGGAPFARDWVEPEDAANDDRDAPVLADVSAPTVGPAPARAPASAEAATELPVPTVTATAVAAASTAAPEPPETPAAIAITQPRPGSIASIGRRPISQTSTTDAPASSQAAPAVESTTAQASDLWRLVTDTETAPAAAAADPATSSRLTGIFLMILVALVIVALVAGLLVMFTSVL
jgi:hypothetical protein